MEHLQIMLNKNQMFLNQVVGKVDVCNTFSWWCNIPPQKNNITMENPPFESMYFLLKMRFFQCHVSFQVAHGM